MRSLLRRRSYDSVDVTWLDREAARRAARGLGVELARERDDVTGVLLFGSIQRGDAVPGSDMDLLVVLRDSDTPYLDRLPMEPARIDGLEVDIFPYTEREVLRLRRDASSLVASAFREGAWVVGPPDALDSP